MTPRQTETAASEGHFFVDNLTCLLLSPSRVIKDIHHLLDFFFSVSFDNTINLTSSAAPFRTIWIFTSPRVLEISLVWSNFTERLSRGLNDSDDLPFRFVCNHSSYAANGSPF